MLFRRRVGETRRIATFAVAVLLAVGASFTGIATPASVRADCGSQGPVGAIRGHRGFAFDGVVRSVEGRREPSEGWLYRVTIDVSEMLAGEPVNTVAFDLGRGDCSHLQGDRYKSGDRLIVTASAPPIEGSVAHLPDALTWRYEWADRWSFHGLPEDLARTMPRTIRLASTRDEILALVAPEHLTYRVDHDAWSVALARAGRDERLTDAVPWDEGFVALGGRTVNRHQGSEERIIPTIWISESGEAWEEVRSPFPEVTVQAASVERLAVFQDRLYAFGIVDGRLGVWTSEDGRSWSGTGPDGAAGRTGRRVVVGAAATNDRLIAITGPWRHEGESALEVWTSLDGKTWALAVPTGLAGIVADLTTGPAGFLIRSCLCSVPAERWLLKSSADGIAWEHLGETPSVSYGFAYDGAALRHLAATLEIRENGDTIAAVDASADGVAWTRLTTAPGTESNQASIAAAEGTIVLLGSRYARDDRRSFVMVSRDDGATWTHSMVPGARRAECVTKAAIGTSSVVLIGDCGPYLAWVTGR